MSRCLRDEGLWVLHEGGGNDAQRVHVKECVKCAARLQQLGSDLRVLSQVLREAPPIAAVERARRGSWRWAPLAAACAAAVFVVWNGIVIDQRPTQTTTVASAQRDQEIIETLEHEVYDSLFTNEDIDLALMPRRVSTLTYVQAALDGGWPCERATLFKRAACDQRPFFLMGENR
jgi:hypothetical protein